MGRHSRKGEPSRRTLDRNWDELMQEIRVTQTGVQILTGFLLTVPFSPRFEDLTGPQRWVYLAVLGGSVLTTCLVVAPVAFHRLLFRSRRRFLLVEAGARLASLGLLTLALTISGVGFLIADIVVGMRFAAVVAVVLLLVFAAVWVVLPVALARSERYPPGAPPDGPRRRRAGAAAQQVELSRCDDPQPGVSRGDEDP